mmetsp:Transcript_46444/g.133736  ORF Transcript_46444/g.133736 Transcript_46444/m.133736 type:complete len:351 (+) Transcript_46444:267-1319(+)
MREPTTMKEAARDAADSPQPCTHLDLNVTWDAASSSVAIDPVQRQRQARRCVEGKRHPQEALPGEVHALHVAEVRVQSGQRARAPDKVEHLRGDRKIQHRSVGGEGWLDLRHDVRLQLGIPDPPHPGAPLFDVGLQALDRRGGNIERRVGVVAAEDAAVVPCSDESPHALRPGEVDEAVALVFAAVERRGHIDEVEGAVEAAAAQLLEHPLLRDAAGDVPDHQRRDAVARDGRPRRRCATTGRRPALPSACCPPGPRRGRPGMRRLRAWRVIHRSAASTTRAGDVARLHGPDRDMHGAVVAAPAHRPKPERHRCNAADVHRHSEPKDIVGARLLPRSAVHGPRAAWGGER